MALARINTVVVALLWIVTFAQAQTTILFQGFESPAPCGSWGYTGGVVNPEIARTGANSNRVGRNAQSNTITFNTVSVAGLAGVQLRFWHSVRPGSGPGMDVREGAVAQVSLNGGAWVTIGQVGGTADHNYTWANTPGGATGTSCTDYQMPNPLVYNVPGGTNTLAFRVLSVVGGDCATFNANMAAATAGNYDRNDEGFFIDDVTITTTSPAPYPFIWTGAFDTNWHDCRNWNFGVVPNATSNVTIDQSALNNCEVFTAAATCASLSVSSNSGVARNLAVRNGQSLDVQGPVTVTKTAVGMASVGITVGDLALAQNGTLQATSLTMTGTATGALNAFVRGERALSILRVNGPVTVQPGGYLDLQGITTGGSLQLQGNYTNNDSEAAFDEQFSLVVFWGGAPQSINTAGFQERFGAIRMSKTAGDLTLNAPISLRTATALQFTGASPLGGGTIGGRILSSLPNGLLSLESTVTLTTGATDNSHVNGPIQKFGTANFIFPIGKSFRWRPVQLQNIAGVATDAFIAEYFPVSAYTLSSVMEPTLDHISDCEYWTINRSAGTANARVVLSYHTTYSCGVTLPADLRVAKLDEVPAPDIWRDRGNNGVTVQAWGGYVPTTVVETDFGYWTLASISTENPLPVELVSFTAEAQRQEVLCKWITASEWNNDHFTVERSADGLTFEAVGLVRSLGDSWDLRAYSFTDKAPLPGVSYYRLRQTDLDGSWVHSAVVAVEMTGMPGVRVIVREGELEVWHDLPAGASFNVLDASGRLIRTGSLDEGRTSISIPSEIRGILLLRLEDDLNFNTIRFFH
ncbi:MAG: hypothetical protein JNL52_04030 [Flavobacteriales bacterium]|nr:hypothetical protein [Flavobacteriales bacterium]